MMGEQLTIPGFEEFQKEAKLTEPHSDRISGLLANYKAGMAHFPGTGPEGTVRHECEHYAYVDNDAKIQRAGRYKTGERKGELNPRETRPCRKFRNISKNFLSPRIPFDTPSCSRFEAIKS